MMLYNEFDIYKRHSSILLITISLNIAHTLHRFDPRFFSLARENQFREIEGPRHLAASPTPKLRLDQTKPPTLDLTHNIQVTLPNQTDTTHDGDID